MSQEQATLEMFEQLDIRVGTVVDAKPFPEARKPAIQLWIDFGATIAPRQIGPFTSEVLTLGLPSEDGDVILLRPDFTVPDGGRMY